MRISSNSSLEKCSTSSWLNLTSVISLMKSIFHLSLSSISSKTIFRMSSIQISSMLFLSVNKRMFLKLDPVVERTSFLINESNCLGISFFDFTIWFRKLRNLSMRTNLRCFVLEIGSIKLWCVCNGRSKMNIFSTFYVQSTYFCSVAFKLSTRFKHFINIIHKLKPSASFRYCETIVTKWQSNPTVSACL